MKEPTEQQIANALMQRGTTHVIVEDVSQVLEDFTRLETMPGLDVETRAAALISRAMALARAGRTVDEFADCEMVIDRIGGVSSDMLAAALFHRGNALTRCGKFEQAINDFGRAIRTPGAGQELVARAIVARGFAAAEFHRSEPGAL